MDISEKKIEDLIINTIQNGEKHKLYERGLYGLSGYEHFFRQVNLGEYGRLDLVGLRYVHGDCHQGKVRTLHVGLIEIKKGEININTYMQAIRYCKGIERLLSDTCLNLQFNIFLIGSSICNGDFIYLADFVNNLSVYTVDLCLDNGIRFTKEQGYYLTKYKKPNIPFEILSDVEIDIKEKIKEYVLNTELIPEAF